MAFPTEVGTADGQLQDDTSESFAFALVNGALGVFEVCGRRIRDFRLLLGKIFSRVFLHRVLTCVYSSLFLFLLDRNGQKLLISILLMG